MQPSWPRARGALANAGARTTKTTTAVTEEPRCSSLLGFGSLTAGGLFGVSAWDSSGVLFFAQKDLEQVTPACHSKRGDTKNGCFCFFYYIDG